MNENHINEFYYFLNFLINNLKNLEEKLINEINFLIQNKSIIFPINLSNSFLILLIKNLFILENINLIFKKNSNLFNYLFLPFIFNEDFFLEILNFIKIIVNKLDSNILLNLLQSFLMIDSIYFLSYKIIFELFSLILNLTSNSNILISSTSIALFQHILILLSNKHENSQYLIDNYIINIKSNFNNLNDIINFILITLIKDLFNLIIKNTPTKLNNIQIKNIIIYDLLEIIFNLSFDFNLLKIFDLILLESFFSKILIDPLSINFILNLSYCLVNEDSINSKIILFHYINWLNKSDFLPYSLYFIHNYSYFLSKKITSFLENDFNNLDLLFLNLFKIYKNNKINNLLEFQFKPFKKISNSFKNEISSFLLIFPFEINSFLIKSFVNSKLISKKIYEKIKNHLTIIIIDSICFSSISIFGVMIQFFIDYLNLISRFEDFSLLNNIFSNLTSYLKFSEQSTNIEISKINSFEKEQQWPILLATILTLSPKSCQNNWLILFQSIFSYKNNYLDPNFANNFKIPLKMEILDYLLQCKKISNEFIISFLNYNQENFKDFWPILKLYLINQNNISLFIDLLKECFNNNTSELLLEILYIFINNLSELNYKMKLLLLNELKCLLTKNLNIISNGWNNIFLILNPENFSKKEELVQISADILSNICNDYLSFLSLNYIKNCLNTIFQFVLYQENINISLSSLDLLWSLSKAIKQSEDLWSFIFENVIILINDNRSSISLSAISYLFNLLSTTFQNIPFKVLEELINNKFINLLNLFNENNSLQSSTISSFLLEISHFINSFWTKLNSFDSFSLKLIPILIEKQTNFSFYCNNYEIVGNTFEFYTNFFQCNGLNNEIELLLLNSILKLIQPYSLIDDPNSIIFSTFGRILGKCFFLNQKRFLNENNLLNNWLNIFNLVINSFPSSNFVHILPYRSCETISKIFPLPENESFLIINFLINKVFELNNNVYSKFFITLLTDIYSNSLQIEFKLNFFNSFLKIINFEESLNLLNLIINTEFIYTDINLYFYCFSFIPSNFLKILPLMNQVSLNNQIKFIQRYKNDFINLLNIWDYYCNPEKNTFNNEINQNIFLELINFLKNLILTNENDIYNYLIFLINTKSKNSLNNLNNFHLFLLLPSISIYLNIKNEKILNLIQNIFNLISLEIQNEI